MFDFVTYLLNTYRAGPWNSFNFFSLFLTPKPVFAFLLMIDAFNDEANLSFTFQLILSFRGILVHNTPQARDLGVSENLRKYLIFPKGELRIFILFRCRFHEADQMLIWINALCLERYKLSLRLRIPSLRDLS